VHKWFTSHENARRKNSVFVVFYESATWFTTADTRYTATRNLELYELKLHAIYAWHTTKTCVCRFSINVFSHTENSLSHGQTRMKLISQTRKNSYQLSEALLDNKKGTQKGTYHHKKSTSGPLKILGEGWRGTCPCAPLGSYARVNSHQNLNQLKVGESARESMRTVVTGAGCSKAD
jgi:hypothetical protein